MTETEYKPEKLDVVLARHICNTLIECAGNVTKAAKALDVTWHTLDKNMKKYGITVRPSAIVRCDFSKVG